MLYDFVTANSDELISRTRGEALGEAMALGVHGRDENGVPLFLTQLAETLRLETSPTPFSDGAIVLASGSPSAGRRSRRTAG